MAAKTAGTASRNCLWLKNETARRGVPLRRSFERWIAAVAELRKRTNRTAVNILIVGSVEGQRYNREFRGRDYATNVLSFPYEAAHGDPSGLLGDIVMCAPVIEREAHEQGKKPRDHYAHLTVHGVLHLLGYDHQSAADAKRMESLERAALARLDIADPYVERPLRRAARLSGRAV